MSSLQNLVDPFVSFIVLGGPVVAVLGVLSVLCLAVVLLKIWQFWRNSVGQGKNSSRAVKLWQSGQHKPALSMARAGSSVSSRAVAQAMELRSGGQLDRDDIEERVARFSTECFHALQSGFRFLDAVVQLAPLLGLFGTVLGMIEAFQNLQGAGSSVDPSMLAGGIWVALLTTAAGLAVAMPVSLFLTCLESRLESERVSLATSVSDILAAPVMSSEAEVVAMNEDASKALAMTHAG